MIAAGEGGWGRMIVVGGGRRLISYSWEDVFPRVAKVGLRNWG